MIINLSNRKYLDIKVAYRIELSFIKIDRSVFISLMNYVNIWIMIILTFSHIDVSFEHIYKIRCIIYTKNKKITETIFMIIERKRIKN
jgi:hypothetical protein